MSFFEALKLAFAAILAHKLRSFLTLLGLIFGVATVIVVVSLIEGFNKYVDDKIANIGTNAFSVQRFSIEDYSSVEALNAARRRNKDVSVDDLLALKNLGGPVKDAGGKSASMADVKFGDKTLKNVQVNGATPNIAEIEKKGVDHGRYFIDAEEESRKYVCFLGFEIAEKLFPGENPLGKTIKIDGRTFSVVGVGSALGSAFGQSRDMYVSMPLSTFLSMPLINAAARTQLQGNRLRMLQNGLSIFANVIQTDIKM